MPPGFGELTSLQRLDYFQVGRGQWSKLGEMAELKLRGSLKIRWDDDWDGIRCLQPLVKNLQEVIIEYSCGRMPDWTNPRSGNYPSLLLNLTRLSFISCLGVKSLAPFRPLRNIKSLVIVLLAELEYMEDEEEENEGNYDGTEAAVASNALLLPCLEELEMLELPELKGWSRRVEAAVRRKHNVVENGEEHSSSTSSRLQLPSFPSLVSLRIERCKELKYMPLCPILRRLAVERVDTRMLLPQLLSIQEHSSPSTSTSSSSTLHGTGESLEYVHITDCDELMSFPGKSLTSLECLYIQGCSRLKDVELAPSQLNILKHLILTECRELEMWEEDKRAVDWASLPNLQWLLVDEIPSPEILPNCLRNLQSLGKLQIKGYDYPGCEYESLMISDDESVAITDDGSLVITDDD